MASRGWPVGTLETHGWYPCLPEGHVPGPLGMAWGDSAVTWPVSYNNSQRVKYMAPWAARGGPVETLVW